MKLFSFSTTERNGEQEYNHDHLVHAKTLAEAKERAIKYCKHWYDGGLTRTDKDKDGYYEFEFFNGEIFLELNDIVECDENYWKSCMFQKCLI